MVKRVAMLLCALSVVIAALGAASGIASAESEIMSFTASPSSTQAGAHPDVFLQTVYTNRNVIDAECRCNDARTIALHFPTGFIGDPHVLPECSDAELAVGRCPSDSQLGVVRITSLAGYIPLYNMVPHGDQSGLTGLVIPYFGTPFFLTLNGRTNSDYGLDSVSAVITHPLPTDFLELHLWGVPAAPVHNSARFRTPLDTYGFCSEDYPTECSGITGASSNLPERPLLQNPTTCEVSLTASIDIGFYDESAASADYPWPPTTGCQQLSFNPSLTATPTTSAADTPSGIDIDLSVPQIQSATTPSQSELKSNTVILPPGFTINAGAADGKSACSDASTAIGTLGPAACPDFSKIGTVSVEVGALPGPISGGMYLGEPKPGNPYRLVLAADGFGTHVKLVGSVHADPTTGQLVATFESPQTNLQEVDLHFFGSERGLLATPVACGTYPVESEFVPWDAALSPQRSLSYFTINSGPIGTPCPGTVRPFNPSIQAGSANATAGRFSSFTFELNRNDGDQFLTSTRVVTPPGFLASIRGIPYCPESAIAALANPSYLGVTEQTRPACPIASAVGSVVASAGAGTHPLFVHGRIYLAGPYHGAPVSLLFVIPAVAGPYDFGVVVTRVAVSVDPVTAQLTAFSDPFPMIVGGVPLRTRSIQINLDRSNFTLNPTSCSEKSIGAVVTGDQGGVSQQSVHYQVDSCGALPFKPRLKISFAGGLHRLGHPAIHSVLVVPKGSSNTRQVSVTLPSGELLDNSHFRDICTRVDSAAHSCPPASIIGHAEASTPLLDEALDGPIYLRSSSHDLPDLVIDLAGRFEIQLAARVDSTKSGGLRVNFESLPDAPVSSVTVDLQGGSKGLLQNSEDLCSGGKAARVSMTGQNGLRTQMRVPIRIACHNRHRRHRKHRPATIGDKSTWKDGSRR